jgi:hypothetical protein
LIHGLAGLALSVIVHLHTSSNGFCIRPGAPLPRKIVVSFLPVIVLRTRLEFICSSGQRFLQDRRHVPLKKQLEVLEPMNIIPVITLFGGLSAFFTLAFALRLAIGKTQVVDQQDDNKLAG